MKKDMVEEEADIEAIEGVHMDEEATEATEATEAKEATEATEVIEAIEAREEVVEEVDITKVELQVIIPEQNYRTH